MAKLNLDNSLYVLTNTIDKVSEDNDLQLFLIETIIGLYALDEDYNIVARQNWPNEPRKIANIIRRLHKGDNIFINKFISELNSFDEVNIFSDNPILIDSLKQALKIEYKVNLIAIRSFKEKMEEIAVEEGYIGDELMYGSFSNKVLSEIARMEVHEKLSNREALLIPVVQLLGELDTTLNSLSNRMREWYGVHFPELGNRVRENEDYARIISKMGFRENITATGLKELSIKKKDAERIEKTTNKSMGAQFENIDMQIVADLANRLLGLFKYRDDIFKYLSMLAEEIAPNLSFLAGPVLAAKLIEKAGSLKKLGMMPSSKIQVLGAERALFRAIRSNAKPPKHGLLYQHPYVNAAPRDRRGNRARSLAAKIAIASRADLFTGNFIADELISKLEDFEMRTH